MGGAASLLEAYDHAEAPSRAKGRTDEDHRRAVDAARRCPRCGCEVEPAADSIIRRGAVTILRDPLRVEWRGRPVPLSPTEAVIFELLVRRGRATHDAIDEAMLAFGSRPDTRSVLLWRIKRKFAVLGGASPFEPIGKVGLRFVAEPDETGCRATTIGLRSGDDELGLA